MTLYAIIERTTDGYSIYTENGIFSGMGDTAEGAKNDMLTQIEFYVETCKENGISIPEYLETGEYEIAYKFDVESLLKFYSGIFSKSAQERLTGINQKQLGNYASGRLKPGPQQIQKINEALHELGKELLSISL